MSDQLPYSGAIHNFVMVNALREANAAGDVISEAVALLNAVVAG